MQDPVAKQKYQILLIHRNPRDLEQLTEFLHHSSRFGVNTAAAVEQAIALLQQRLFDAIVLSEDVVGNDSALSTLNKVAPRVPIVTLRAHSEDQPEWAKDLCILGTLDQAALLREDVDSQFGATLLQQTVANAIHRSQAEHYEQALRLQSQSTMDGQWSWDLKSNTLDYSDRFLEILGLDQGELGNSWDSLRSRMHEEDSGRVQQELNVHLSGKSNLFSTEFRVRCKDESWRWVECRGCADRDEFGVLDVIAGTLRDNTVRKRMVQLAEQDSFHDPITGLPNRAYLLDRLWRGICRVRRRDNYVFALIYFEIDGLEEILKDFGSPTRDQLLLEIGRQLSVRFRSVDTISLASDNAFAILADDIQKVRNALIIGERVQKLLAQPLQLGKRSWQLTASIGISVSTGNHSWPEDMLREAIKATEKAQEAGGNCMRLVDDRIADASFGTLELERQLSKALKKEELTLHYQPVINLKTGRIAGLEAFVRWQHPRRGLLLANDFIHLAEESGQIEEIGKWAFRRACGDILMWEKNSQLPPGLRVSLNMSNQQFRSQEVFHAVREILHNTGVSPERISVDISEKVLNDSADIAREVIVNYRSCHIQVSVDGFGSGFSSLNALAELPIYALKIDRQFIHRLSEDAKSIEMVRAIRNLARTFGFRVVALGVQTDLQGQILQELDFDYAQGLLFREPLTAQTIQEVMHERVSLQPMQLRSAPLPPFLVAPSNGSRKGATPPASH